MEFILSQRVYPNSIRINILERTTHAAGLTPSRDVGAAVACDGAHCALLSRRQTITGLEAFDGGRGDQGGEDGDEDDLELHLERVVWGSVGDLVF